MAKIQTSLFNKNRNTVLHAEFNSPERAYGSYDEIKQSDSRIDVRDGQIVSFDQNAVSLFGFIKGAPFASLFASPAAYKVKLSELERHKTCRAYLRRADSRCFWARITADGHYLVISDSHIEENFLIDGEDLIESMERRTAGEEIKRVDSTQGHLKPDALFLENPSLFL